MKENLIRTKTYKFALEIISLYKYLIANKKEYILAKQILRCGTSIGANIEEAIGSHSRKDFFSKITISYKEARETEYWLRLLHDSHYIEKEYYNKSISYLTEILRIITSIQKTIRLSEKN